MCGTATARSHGTLRNFISCQVIAISEMAIIMNLITYQWDTWTGHKWSQTRGVAPDDTFVIRN